MAKQILIADDNEADLAQLLEALAAAGAEAPVTTVTNGEEVLRYLRGEGRFADRVRFPLPTVLLLDLKMPRMTGFQVLEWLKAQSDFKDLVVVVVSGLEAIQSVQAAYDLGAHSFIRKQCAFEDISNLSKIFGEVTVD